MSKNTTRKKSPGKKTTTAQTEVEAAERKLEAQNATYQKIEKWATDSIQPDNQSQQLALLALLDEIEQADNYTDMAILAGAAKYAVFKASIGLHDEAIESVLVCGGMK